MNTRQLTARQAGHHSSPQFPQWQLWWHFVHVFATTIRVGFVPPNTAGNATAPDLKANEQIQKEKAELKARMVELLVTI